MQHSAVNNKHCFKGSLAPTAPNIEYGTCILRKIKNASIHTSIWDILRTRLNFRMRRRTLQGNIIGQIKEKLTSIHMIYTKQYLSPDEHSSPRINSAESQLAAD